MAINTSMALMMMVKRKGIHAVNRGSVTVIPKSTSNTVWPAVILAKSRTLREKGFAKKLMISMGISNGSRRGGTPGGQTTFKKPTPWFKNPVMMLMVKPSKAKNPVTMIWLVTVKAPGTNPERLQQKTNKKREQM